MSESAALEKSGILKSVAGSLGASNLGISSLGTLKEGGENDGDGRRKHVHSRPRAKGRAE